MCQCDTFFTYLFSLELVKGREHDLALLRSPVLTQYLVPGECAVNPELQHHFSAVLCLVQVGCMLIAKPYLRDTPCPTVIASDVLFE